MMLAIGLTALLAACLREVRTKILPLDRKDMDRHRRESESKCRDWIYPFE